MTKISRQEAGRMGQAKSAPIWQAAKQARITEYTLNPSKCAACGKALEYSQRHNKFCTMSCSASVNNLNNRRHGDDPGNCLNCENRLGASRLTYCSTGCHRGYEWKCFVAKIDKAGEFETANPRAMKKYLTEKYGYSCSICHGTEWMGTPVPLILDHINGHADDNHVSNLRLVCGNCDMQLPTYKGKNAGNGRHSRRERYAKGQSY